LRIPLRQSAVPNNQSFGTLVRKQFFHATLMRLKKNFRAGRAPQLQCNVAVRARRPIVTITLSKQLASTPLTRVLAVVKLATRLKVVIAR
jgi:hypothetical protein